MTPAPTTMPVPQATLTTAGPPTEGPLPDVVGTTSPTTSPPETTQTSAKDTAEPAPSLLPTPIPGAIVHYVVTCSMHVTLPLEEFGTRISEFRAVVAQILGVRLEAIHSVTFRAGSTIVNFTVDGNGTIAESQNFRRQVQYSLGENPPPLLTAIFGTVLSFVTSIIELRLPIWVYALVPITGLACAVAVIFVVNRRAKSGKLQPQLYRLEEATVAVRFGRLYVNGEAVLDDGEYHRKVDAFTAEEEDEIFAKATAQFLVADFSPSDGTPSGNVAFAETARDEPSAMEVAAAQWKVISPPTIVTDFAPESVNANPDDVEGQDQAPFASSLTLCCSSETGSTPSPPRQRRTSLVAQQGTSPFARSPQNDSFTAPPTPSHDPLVVFSPPSSVLDETRPAAMFSRVRRNSNVISPQSQDETVVVEEEDE